MINFSLGVTVTFWFCVTWFVISIMHTLIDCPTSALRLFTAFDGI